MDVHRIRRKFKLTQREFARLVGVDPNTVARWERGAVHVPETARRFLYLLGALFDEGQAKRRTRRGTEAPRVKVGDYEVREKCEDMVLSVENLRAYRSKRAQARGRRRSG